MFKSRFASLAILAFVIASVFSQSSVQAQFSFGSAYSASNSPKGNRIQTFLRIGTGHLFHTGSVATGGNGTGGGLGNQYGVRLSDNGRWLLAVNAASDSVSVFFVGFFGELYLTDVVPSGGDQPVSVAINKNIVYVLNGGGAGNIQGFELGFLGDLSPIDGATLPLSGAETTAAAQIEFSPDGKMLVVTEKATSLIDVYRVDSEGVAEGPVVNPSSGMTPFGFGFAQRNRLIVSEAFGGAPGASAVSSYTVQSNGSLDEISSSVPDTQTAACWIEVTDDGRFAYTTNTGSGNISGYSIDRRTGKLTLLDSDGITGVTGAGSGPIDVSISRDSQFLYVLNSGTHDIKGFRVNRNGSLTPVSTVKGLQVGSNGLIVR